MSDSTVVSLPQHEAPSTAQLEELLALQRNVLQEIVNGSDLDELLDDLCRLVEELVPGTVASVMLYDLEANALRVRSAPSLPPEATEAFSCLVPGEGQGSCGNAVLKGTPVFVADALVDPRWDNVRDVARRFGIRHCWSIPVLGQDRKPVGTLAITGFEVREPSGFHMRLLQTASYLASIALQNAHSRAELARSEARLTEIADAMPGVIFRQEVQEGRARFTYVAPGAEDLLGVVAGELMQDADLLWSRVDERDRCLIDQVLGGNGSGQVFKECWFRLRLPDGNWRWIEAQARRVEEDATTAWVGIFFDASEQYERERRLHRAGLVFDHAQEGIMITNDKLEIIEVNPAFTRITGYEEDEVLGENPRILSSGRHGRAFYRQMWEHLRRDGHWEGEIWNRRKNGEIYPEWLSITVARDPRSGELQYIGVFTDITRLKQSEEELAYLAHHDTLTGLPNRLMFRMRLDHALARARRDGRYVALLFIDLDRFKNLNDTLGHAFGDQILCQVAARLARVIREQDLVARLGGDEFVVLLEDLQDSEASGRVAEALIEVLRQPYTVEEREFFLSASIGISHFPVDGEQPDDLLRAADLALYQAKEEGRSTWRRHVPELSRRVQDFVDLEGSLRQALERGEFCFYYQPQVDARSRRVIGAEALIRWQHPEQGMIPPNRFLPLAEEIGLIVDIGDWVLNEACRQLVAWQQAGYGDLRVSVNLAGQQIMDPRLIAKVRDAIEEHGCPPGRLELEILESFVMRNAEESVRTLTEIRALGVGLAIDDFGSGYSSLAYLKRLPIDKLKIDQSLVFDIPDDPDDVAIAQAVIALGHSLGLTVCAEGVETLAQLQFLVGEGVDQIQGYHFSRPLPADAFLAYLRQQDTAG